MRKKICFFMLACVPALAINGGESVNTIKKSDANQWVNTVEETIQREKPDAFTQYQGLDPRKKSAFLVDFLRYERYTNPYLDTSVAETDMIEAVLKKYDSGEYVSSASMAS
jgi:hypothetical protein